MQIRIIIQSIDEDRSEVWRGVLDIERDDIYVAKISIIADGEPHPICDIPFSLDSGWWEWHPGKQNNEYTIPINDRRSYYNLEYGDIKP